MTVKEIRACRGSTAGLSATGIVMKPDIQALLTAAKETLSVEHKCWLDLQAQNDRGVLAKALIALANYGGGHVVVGVHDHDRSPQPRPTTIARYTQDAIASVVKKFADPPFECLLDYCLDPDSGVELAVISVQSDLRDIVLSKSGIPGGPIQEFRPYVRKPGPSSEIPNTPAEWRTLFDRCVKSRQAEMLDAIRGIVQGSAAVSQATKSPDEQKKQDMFTEASVTRWKDLVKSLPQASTARLRHGCWTVNLALSGPFNTPDMPTLRQMIQETGRVNHSGWGPFPFLSREVFAPKNMGGTIEAWLVDRGDDDRDPGSADFWRVSPEGRAFMLRGYREDGPGQGLDKDYPIGKAFDVITHPRLIGEVVLWAERLASLLADVQSITMSVTYTGLKGRELVTWGNRRRRLYGKHISRENDFLGRCTFAPGRANTNLPEIVHPLLKPLYALFSFFELPVELVTEELADMRRRRF